MASQEKAFKPPTCATDAVLVKCTEEISSETVKGYDFNKGINYQELLKSYARSGFQATNFGRAVEEINKMIDKKMEEIPIEKKEGENLNPCGREKTNCSIFLSYTSNLISAGVREIIRYLVEHNMVDCIVCTAGGIEEDFIKCLGPTFLGDFALKGAELRSKGINRIGNLLVPNDNYCLFEDWLMPILDQMLKEQKENGTLWTPSKVIDRLGKEIDNPESVYYWAHKNNIPVFSPAITDGSIGDLIYFHSYKNPGLVIDVVEASPAYGVYISQLIRYGRACSNYEDFIARGQLLTTRLQQQGYTTPRLKSTFRKFFGRQHDIVGVYEKSASDIRRMNSQAVYAINTGMIILGGGVVKHHTCNANLMRNGADFSVFVNTASEFDGSDAGASPDEAVSWGKIKMTATPAKVVGEATLIFPLLVAETFARREKEFHTKD